MTPPLMINPISEFVFARIEMASSKLLTYLKMLHSHTTTEI